MSLNRLARTSRGLSSTIAAAYQRMRDALEREPSAVSTTGHPFAIRPRPPTETEQP